MATALGFDHSLNGTGECFGCHQASVTSNTPSATPAAMMAASMGCIRSSQPRIMSVGMLVSIASLAPIIIEELIAALSGGPDAG